MIDSRGRDTGGAGRKSIWQTGKQTVLAANDLADVGGVLAHPTEKNDPGRVVQLRPHRVEGARPGDRSRLELPADRRRRRNCSSQPHARRQELDRGLSSWTTARCATTSTIGRARRRTFLFTNRKSLEGLPLAKMHPRGDQVARRAEPGQLPDAAQGVRSRRRRPAERAAADGACRCTAAPGAATAWGFDPEHQLLANRGYAVLSVNFRGSTGFGKKFTNAGNKEWAGKMHDDLLDAVDWAVDREDRRSETRRDHGRQLRRLCHAGRPDVHARDVRLRRRHRRAVELAHAAEHDSALLGAGACRCSRTASAIRPREEGKKLLDERSPLNFVDKIKRPLLIGQGANDPRVKQAEADQIVEAMQKKKIPVTYVLFPDEGHGFARPENNLAFYAVTEAFLARAPGRHAIEPIGDDFAGSTITCPDGSGQVPGLAEALEKHEFC